MKVTMTYDITPTMIKTQELSPPPAIRAKALSYLELPANRKIVTSSGVKIPISLNVLDTAITLQGLGSEESAKRAKDLAKQKVAREAAEKREIEKDASTLPSTSANDVVLTFNVSAKKIQERLVGYPSVLNNLILSYLKRFPEKMGDAGIDIPTVLSLSGNKATIKGFLPTTIQVKEGKHGPTFDVIKKSFDISRQPEEVKEIFEAEKRRSKAKAELERLQQTLEKKYEEESTKMVRQTKRKNLLLIGVFVIVGTYLYAKIAE